MVLPCRPAVVSARCLHSSAVRGPLPVASGRSPAVARAGIVSRGPAARRWPVFTRPSSAWVAVAAFRRWRGGLLWCPPGLSARAGGAVAVLVALVHRLWPGRGSPAADLPRPLLRLPPVRRLLPGPGARVSRGRVSRAPAARCLPVVCRCRVRPRRSRRRGRLGRACAAAEQVRAGCPRAAGPARLLGRPGRAELVLSPTGPAHRCARPCCWGAASSLLGRACLAVVVFRAPVSVRCPAVRCPGCCSVVQRSGGAGPGPLSGSPAPAARLGQMVLRPLWPRPGTAAARPAG